MPLTNNQTVSWSSTTGVLPYRRVFEVHRSVGEPWWAAYQGGPVTLTMAVPGRVRRIRGLRVLRPMPSSHPDLMAFEVTDLRWAWARAWIIGRFNMRRKSGNRRIVFKDILGNAEVVDDVEYDPASLNPPFGGQGQRHTSDSIIEYALDQLIEQLPAQWQFEYTIDDIESSVRPESVEIDDEAPRGLTRALQYAPSSTLRVNDDATVTVISQADGSELEQLDESGPAVRGAAVAVTADHRLVAPSAFDILFTRELELRFDYFTQPDEHATFSTDRDARTLENVAAVVDQDLQGYPPGAWATFDKLFTLWGSNPVTGAPISHEFIRRQYMNPHFLMGLAEFGEQRAEMNGDQSQWSARALSIAAHYLLTFRVPRRWVDRVLRFGAHRLAIFDTETGTGAKAQAWMDFAIKYGARAQRISKQALLARNIDAWVQNLSTVGNGVQAPADVRILDQDEGIVHVGLKTDPYGFGVQAIPSALEDIPTAKIGDVNGRPRFFGEVRGPEQAVPRLKDDHRMSLILSAVPKYPIGLQQLHRIRITPGELTDFADILQGVPTDPAGPVWTVRIPPSIETARFAWQDGQAAAIEGAFGLTDWDPDALSLALSSLLINGDVFQSIGKTAAAALLAGFRNRPLGAHTEYLNDQHRVTGAIRQLVHAVGRGQATTTQEYLSELPSRNLFDHLPEDAARVVRRLIR